MAHYAEWREATDPDRPLARLDGVVQFGAGMLGGAASIPCCGLLSPVGFLLAWRAAGKALLLRRVERMRDVPARDLQLACRLTLKHRAVVYGRDEGLVSLVRGGLLFEGRRTSFSLSRAEAGAWPIERGLAFRFPSPAGDCFAEIEGLDRREFAAAFQEWNPLPARLNSTVVFPPYRPDTTPLGSARRLARAAWTLGLAGSALALFLGWAINWSLGYFVALFFLTAMALYDYRHRRVLEKLEAFARDLDLSRSKPQRLAAIEWGQQQEP